MDKTVRGTSEAAAAVVRYLFIFGLGISLVAISNVSAQEETAAAEKLPPVVVTGSLIPTTELIGSAPVDTFSVAEIQRVGATDLALALKRLSPDFTGGFNIGQEVNNGGFGEANVLIHNLPTLVLLNGRRLGNSSFSNGSFVDVNTIPIAAVERIEVLKDGSSALYGSDAIGGVVNIILKKGFNGVQVGGRYGGATGEGKFTQSMAYGVIGVTSEKGWITAGGQWDSADPLLTKNRNIASLSNEKLNEKNIAFANYISPSFPGKVQDGTTGQIYLLANSPFLGPQSPTGSTFAGYNPGLVGGPLGADLMYHTPGSPPVVPGFSASGGGSIDLYNAAAIANGYVDPTGNGLGPYVEVTGTPASAAILNTTQFGTHSIQSQDLTRFFATGEYDLFGKQCQLFGDFLYANIQSVATLAPSPVISLFDGNILVPGNNVFNPFGVDLGPPTSTTTPRVRHRYVQSGNRIFDSLTDYYHFVGGLKGEFAENYTYNAAYTYNQSDQTQFTRNAINGAALDLALQPNNDPAIAAQGLSNLRTGSSGFVPQYNIFFSPTATFPTTQGSNPQSTIDGLSTTLFQSGISTEWDADGLITGTPFDLPGGKFGFATGGGYGDATLDITFDGLTQIGKVPGLNAAEPTSGNQTKYYWFIETRFPLTSPEMDVPLLNRLEVAAAGRYSSYDPGGSKWIPKVTGRYNPLDEQITFRGGYSESFIAPTTFELFGGPAANFPTLSLPRIGGDTNTIDSLQEQTKNISTPTLQSQDSVNYGAGVVIAPKAIPGLTVSCDWYHIKVTDFIFRLSEQAILDDLQAFGSDSQFAPLFEFAGGGVLQNNTPNQIGDNNWGNLGAPLDNGATIETQGVDVQANYVKPTDQYGTFNMYAAANVIFEFTYEDPVGGGPFEYGGEYTDSFQGLPGPQGTIPDFLVTTGMTWDFKDFTYACNARYVPEVHDFLGDQITLDGSDWTIDSWFSVDMQAIWTVGRTKTEKAWYDGTAITLGCNNVTNEEPSLIASSTEDNTDKSVYDIIGRFIYFQIDMKF